MEIKELLETLRDILAADETLTKYCQDTFGAKQTVFLGMNHQDPPDNTLEMPAVVIDAVQLRERAGTRERHKIVIGMMVRDSEKIVAPQKITYRGFLRVEELRQYVEYALLRNQSQLKQKVSIEEAESWGNMIFPIFASKSVISIEGIVSSRGW